MKALEHRGNYLSPLALRIAVKNIIQLQEAGVLEDAERECWLAVEEERRALQQRSIGQELSVHEVADFAARLLGVGRDACEQAAVDVIFPNRAQVAAKVLRAWSKEIGKPRKGRR
jgi:hypothetical protein